MIEKFWQVAQLAPDDFVEQFPEHPNLICQLLYSRGLKTQDQIDEFFDADYSAHLLDPYLFNDMDKAIRRILQAVEKKERIVIYGDYDADG
ncbi:MAG: single-stranded-DNA-specific exonuclease RecJ, partial [Patescibacteria group bacterium]